MNVAMCANDLMFVRWQVNEADCLSFNHHTQTVGYFVNRQLDFQPTNGRSSLKARSITFRK